MVTLLIIVRVGTLSSLLAVALLCILPYHALHSGHSMTKHDQGKTDGVTTLAALNKAVGLTLVWEEVRRPWVCPEALGVQPFSSTVATDCFPRAASQG